MDEKLTPNQRRCVERLGTFADFAFLDVDAAREHGRWRTPFAERIGASFDGRLILEVGCADAALLARLAAKFPHAAFVGIEWKYDDLLLAAERVAAAGLRNVALIRGRAQELPRFFADAELDELWVFHPEPCDRPAERANRLFTEPFLLDGARVLRDGAPLTLKTDHAGYYQTTLAMLGLPEPDWAVASPRARRRDLLPAAELPPRSDATLRVFEVCRTSNDFWNDPAAQAHAADRPFAGDRTTYEQRFYAKRRPIFYLEIERQPRQRGER